MLIALKDFPPCGHVVLQTTFQASHKLCTVTQSLYNLSTTGLDWSKDMLATRLGSGLVDYEGEVEEAGDLEDEARKVLVSVCILKWARSLNEPLACPQETGPFLRS